MNPSYSTLICICLKLIAFGLQQEAVHAIECLSCVNIHNSTACHVTKSCSQNELCFTEVSDIGEKATFNLGCKPSNQCYSNSGQILVGRAMVTTCNQCCSVDYCNSKLCSHFNEVVATSSPSCTDNPDFNCEFTTSFFDICHDTHHAKTVCRKYCGLCDLVDGFWGTWGEWSMCEKTCGESKKVRVRACDDPAPAHGGLDCLGEMVEYKNCSFSPCPVAGGWSNWLAWSSCSKTCGVGLQRRDRHCSNPLPAYGGDHCFGDALENRICLGQACADGGWTLWSVWSGCSATCNGGIKTRDRSCTNPTPSALGKSCIGNNIEYASCTQAVCRETLSAKKVYFSVNTPTGHMYSQHIPVFGHVVINLGSDYNISTGLFTASVGGVYQFIVTFVTAQSTTQCFIRRNNNILVYALTTAVGDYKSATASTYVHLDVGDVIDLSCGGWQYVDHNATSAFSGALLSQD